MARERRLQSRQRPRFKPGNRGETFAPVRPAGLPDDAVWRRGLPADTIPQQKRVREADAPRLPDRTRANVPIKRRVLGRTPNFMAIINSLQPGQVAIIDTIKRRGGGRRRMRIPAPSQWPAFVSRTGRPFPYDRKKYGLSDPLYDLVAGGWRLAVPQNVIRVEILGEDGVPQREIRRWKNQRLEQPERYALDAMRRTRSGGKTVAPDRYYRRGMGPLDNVDPENFAEDASMGQQFSARLRRIIHARPNANPLDDQAFGLRPVLPRIADYKKWTKDWRDMKLKRAEEAGELPKGHDEPYPDAVKPPRKPQYGGLDFDPDEEISIDTRRPSEENIREVIGPAVHDARRMAMARIPKHLQEALQDYELERPRISELDDITNLSLSKKPHAVMSKLRALKKTGGEKGLRSALVEMEMRNPSRMHGDVERTIGFWLDDDEVELAKRLLKNAKSEEEPSFRLINPSDSEADYLRGTVPRVPKFMQNILKAAHYDHPKSIVDNEADYLRGTALRRAAADLRLPWIASDRNEALRASRVLRTARNKPTPVDEVSVNPINRLYGWENMGQRYTADTVARQSFSIGTAEAGPGNLNHKHPAFGRRRRRRARNTQMFAAPMRALPGNRMVNPGAFQPAGLVSRQIKALEGGEGSALRGLIRQPMPLNRRTIPGTPRIWGQHMSAKGQEFGAFARDDQPAPAPQHGAGVQQLLATLLERLSAQQAQGAMSGQGQAFARKHMPAGIGVAFGRKSDLEQAQERHAGKVKRKTIIERRGLRYLVGDHDAGAGLMSTVAGRERAAAEPVVRRGLRHRVANPFAPALVAPEFEPEANMPLDPLRSPGTLADNLRPGDTEMRIGNVLGGRTIPITGRSIETIANTLRSRFKVGAKRPDLSGVDLIEKGLGGPANMPLPPPSQISPIEARNPLPPLPARNESLRDMLASLGLADESAMPLPPGEHDEPLVVLPTRRLKRLMSGGRKFADGQQFARDPRTGRSDFFKRQMRSLLEKREQDPFRRVQQLPATNPADYLARTIPESPSPGDISLVRSAIIEDAAAKRMAGRAERHRQPSRPINRSSIAAALALGPRISRVRQPRFTSPAPPPFFRRQIAPENDPRVREAQGIAGGVEMRRRKRLAQLANDQREADRSAGRAVGVSGLLPGITQAPMTRDDIRAGAPIGRQSELPGRVGTDADAMKSRVAELESRRRRQGGVAPGRLDENLQREERLRALRKALKSGEIVPLFGQQRAGLIGPVTKRDKDKRRNLVDRLFENEMRARRGESLMPVLEDVFSERNWELAALHMVDGEGSGIPMEFGEKLGLVFGGPVLARRNRFNSHRVCVDGVGECGEIIGGNAGGQRLDSMGRPKGVNFADRRNHDSLSGSLPSAINFTEFATARQRLAGPAMMRRPQSGMMRSKPPNLAGELPGETHGPFGGASALKQSRASRQTNAGVPQDVLGRLSSMSGPNPYGRMNRPTWQSGVTDRIGQGIERMGRGIAAGARRIGRHIGNSDFVREGMGIGGDIRHGWNDARGELGAAYDTARAGIARAGQAARGAFDWMRKGVGAGGDSPVRQRLRMNSLRANAGRYAPARRQPFSLAGAQEFGAIESLRRKELLRPSASTLRERAKQAGTRYIPGRNAAGHEFAAGGHSFARQGSLNKRVREWYRTHVDDGGDDDEWLREFIGRPRIIARNISQKLGHLPALVQKRLVPALQLWIHGGTKALKQKSRGRQIDPRFVPPLSEDDWSNLSDSLIQSIENGMDESRPIYRGVGTSPMIDRLRPGSIVAPGSITSWTTNEKVGRAYGNTTLQLPSGGRSLSVPKLMERSGGGYAEAENIQSPERRWEIEEMGRVNQRPTIILRVPTRRFDPREVINLEGEQEFARDDQPPFDPTNIFNGIGANVARDTGAPGRWMGRVGRWMGRVNEGTDAALADIGVSPKWAKRLRNAAMVADSTVVPGPLTTMVLAIGSRAARRLRRRRPMANDPRDDQHFMPFGLRIA